MKTATRVALALVTAALLGGAARAIDAKDLVGTWIVEKGDAPKGAEFEVTKDGKFTLIGEEGGKKLTHKGTYKLTGDKLELTGTDPEGKEHTESVTVKEATKDKLVIVSKQNKEIEFKKK